MDAVTRSVAIVTVTWCGAPYLLMVEHGDGWALPDGHVKPGEDRIEAALCALYEETALGMPPSLCEVLPPVYVRDPRDFDETPAITVPVRVRFPARDGTIMGGADLPEVDTGDAARRAQWIPADCYGLLVMTLRDLYGGTVHAAHRALLTKILASPAGDDYRRGLAGDLAATTALIAADIRLTGGACPAGLEHARYLLGILSATLGDATDHSGFRAAQDRAWANKQAKGFNVTDVPLEFCLLSGEVAEAFDAWRKNRSDLGGELADAAIHLLGVAEMTGHDLGAEVAAKLAVIERRTYTPLPNGVLVKQDTAGGS